MKKEYYYEGLSREQKKAYRVMYEGFMEIQSEFSVLKMDNHTLSEIFFKIRLDHPEIFYVSGFKYRYSERSEYIWMIPEYIFEKKKIEEHKKALENRIQRLIRPVLQDSEEEKELYIHKFICSSVSYDKLKKQYSHEIIGPLQQGVGVCEGIAKTVKLMCDRLSMESVIAISEANPEKGIRYRHAWNVIKLGKEWYHFDATFDNTLGKQEIERFDYVNLSDSMIFKDHEPALYPLPICKEGDSFYYKKKKLSLTKMEDVTNRFKSILRKKQNMFVFHWRGGGLNQEILQEIVKRCEEMAKEKELYLSISVNVPQSVLALHVSEQPFEHKVTLGPVTLND